MAESVPGITPDNIKPCRIPDIKPCHIKTFYFSFPDSGRMIDHAENGKRN